uniref:TF-B3 domain-containing protein n=1 Tax=Oryza barthii TaxID=65489 RepID=A0A0D3G1P4_9ORYZ
MADARGSSSSSGDGGGGEGKGGAGHGDFVGGGQHNWYHGILGAVPPPNVGRQNIVHHQYPAASLIQQHHQSPTMPLPMAQLPYVPQYTVLPTPAVLPSFSLVSQYDLSLIILFDRSSENFQDWVPSNNVAAPHVPSAFQDWRQMCNGSAFMPFGQTAANSNGFYQNLTFNSWTSNNMPRNPVYTSFHPAAIEDHHAPLFHSNNHDIDPGWIKHLYLLLHLFHRCHHHPMDPPIVFRRSDMESEKNDDNPDQIPVSEPPSMNQNGENLIIRFNCREYRVILRKELTNSDVGNIGRIVMPKRDAEAHLPALHQREGVTLKMDDFKFETTWNFKYRFWPNNKSRMYVLESTGGFVKHHGLQTGDIFIIYKSSESGKFVVRGEKAIKPNAIMPVVDCSCKNELNKSEECGSVPFTSTTYGESDGEDYSGDRSSPGAGEVADEGVRDAEPTPHTSFCMEAWREGGETTSEAIATSRHPQRRLRRRTPGAASAPRRSRRPAITIFRKPEFGWYCCAKINRKESEIREQVSKEKVTRRAPFWEKIPF